MLNQITASHTSSAVAGRPRYRVRRAQMRRQDAGVSVLIAGKTFRVADWSEAGMRFNAPRDDSNMAGIYFEANPMPSMNVGDRVAVTMIFRVMGEIIRMPLDTRVIRRENGQATVRFADLQATVRRQFMRVKDLLNAEAFLASQAISYQA